MPFDKISSAAADFFSQVFSLESDDKVAMIEEAKETFRALCRDHVDGTDMSTIQSYYDEHKIILDLNEIYMDPSGKFYINILLEAVNRQIVDVVKFLLEHGADPNQDDCNIRKTHPQWLITIAAKVGNVEIVKLLAQHGAYVNIPTDLGVTALSVAREYRHNDVVDVLAKSGAHSLVQFENNVWWEPLLYFTEHTGKYVQFPYVSAALLPEDDLASEEQKMIDNNESLRSYFEHVSASLQGVISLCHTLEGAFHLDDRVPRVRRLIDIAASITRNARKVPEAKLLISLLQYWIKAPSDRVRRLCVHRITSAFPSTERTRSLVNMLARKLTVLYGHEQEVAKNLWASMNSENVHDDVSPHSEDKVSNDNDDVQMTEVSNALHDSPVSTSAEHSSDSNATSNTQQSPTSPSPSPSSLLFCNAEWYDEHDARQNYHHDNEYVQPKEVALARAQRQIARLLTFLMKHAHLQELNGPEQLLRFLRVLLDDDSILIKDGYHLSRISEELQQIHLLRNRVHELECQVSALQAEKDIITSLSCGVI